MIEPLTYKPTGEPVEYVIPDNFDITNKINEIIELVNRLKDKITKIEAALYWISNKDEYKDGGTIL